MEQQPGASKKLMELCVRTARKNGLENVDWSGHPDVMGKISDMRLMLYEFIAVFRR